MYDKNRTTMIQIDWEKKTSEKKTEHHQWTRNTQTYLLSDARERIHLLCDDEEKKKTEVFCYELPFLDRSLNALIGWCDRFWIRENQFINELDKEWTMFMCACRACVYELWDSFIQVSDVDDVVAVGVGHPHRMTLWLRYLDFGRIDLSSVFNTAEELPGLNCETILSLSCILCVWNFQSVYFISRMGA